MARVVLRVARAVLRVEVVLMLVSIGSACGQQMVSIWSACGQHLVSMWSADGQQMVSMWSAGRQHVVSRWSAYVQHVVSKWSAFGANAGYLLLKYTRNSLALRTKITDDKKIDNQTLRRETEEHDKQGGYSA